MAEPAQTTRRSTTRPRGSASSSTNPLQSTVLEIDRTLNLDKIAEVLAWDITSAVNYSDALCYQGFDPVVTFNLIMKIIGGNNEKKNLLISSIVFALTRGFGGGKTVNNILDRTSEAGGIIIRNMIDTFSIKLNAPQKQTDITFSRILSAFPTLTHKVFVNLLMANRITFGVGTDFNIPEEYLYAGSCAMMNKETWDNYKDEYVEFAVALSKLWNNEQSKETAMKFAELSYMTKLSRSEDRDAAVRSCVWST